MYHVRLPIPIEWCTQAINYDPGKIYDANYVRKGNSNYFSSPWLKQTINFIKSDFSVWASIISRYVDVRNGDNYAK